MPRCPKGTRKNKKTGICENNNNNNKTRKQQLEIKLKKCLDELKKNKNYKNLTEQKNYRKLESKCIELKYKIENLDTNKHLTEEEVLSIMEPYTIDIDSENRESIKERLMALTYSEKYKSCFSGKKTKNLYYMADDKLACFFKYGDKI
jgi:hypothetical protein